jgi:hypothetical protein
MILSLCLGLSMLSPPAPAAETTPADASVVLVLSEPVQDCPLPAWDTACSRPVAHYFKTGYEALDWLNQREAGRGELLAVYSLRRIWVEKDDGKWRVIQ